MKHFIFTACLIVGLQTAHGQSFDSYELDNVQYDSDFSTDYGADLNSDFDLNQNFEVYEFDDYGLSPTPSSTIHQNSSTSFDVYERDNYGFPELTPSKHIEIGDGNVKFYDYNDYGRELNPYKVIITR